LSDEIPPSKIRKTHSGDIEINRSASVAASPAISSIESEDLLAKVARLEQQNQALLKQQASLQSMMAAPVAEKRMTLCIQKKKNFF
jgi:4-aminobutyrate aminotransferase-like enzyme